MNATMKERAILAAVAAVLLAGGYAIGRYEAPQKTVVTEKVHEVQTEKVFSVVDTDTILNALKTLNTQKDVHTVRVLTKNEKTGVVTVTTTTDDKSKSESTSQIQDKTKSEEKKTEDRVVYRDREVTKTIERAKPQWSLAVMPGFEFAPAFGMGAQPFNLLSPLPLKHVMANVLVERRLAGPLFIGAWASTHLDGGLSLRLEW
jgi:hypothetical protein